ncbi:MAG: hypothetical protein V1681_07205 [Candidatus Neomarinimicrobiota bacterium]
MQNKTTKPGKPKASGRKKPANKKSFTIPFDVAVLILCGVLIFILIVIINRSCSKNEDQLEKMKINIEKLVLAPQTEGAQI